MTKTISHAKQTQQTHTTSPRARQIATTLARHGLGYLVGVLGLQQLVPFHHGLLKHPRRAQPYTQPEHLRLALEELGPTCIKLGQMLSTRTDLLPDAYQAELAKLQDAAPTLAFSEVQALIEQALGKPIETLFASFEQTPLAAASIGQAHAATLADGTAVVVKVRRPGAVEQVEADLALLHHLAVTASQRWELASQYDVVGLVEEFAQTLRAELDYVREAHNAERFARNFAGNTTVHIPHIFWETTNARVLTLERIEGIKISDLNALTAAGMKPHDVAERTAKLILQMVFEDRFFHADPHPGNLFVEPDGCIGLIDFGMVGIVDERTQEQLVRLLIALAQQHPDALVDALLELGVTQQIVNRAALQQDMAHFLARYYDQPLGEMALGPMMHEMMEVMRRHRLHLPANLLLLVKTMVMSEGLGMHLDPQFRLTGLLLPYAQRLILQRYSPLFWAKRLGQSGMDAAWLGTELPQQLRRILGDVERGTLTMRIQSTDTDALLKRVERQVTRVVLAMIAAAFIVGLAMLMVVYHPAGLQQWMWLWFGIGFGVVLALGLYLAESIWRSSRH